MNVYGITTVTADQTLTYLMHFDAINYLNSSLTNLFYHCSPKFQGCFLKDLLGKGVVQEKGGVYVCLFVLRFCLFEHIGDGTWFIQDYDG